MPIFEDIDFLAYNFSGYEQETYFKNMGHICSVGT